MQRHARHARLDTTGLHLYAEEKDGTKPWNAVASKSKLPPLRIGQGQNRPG